MARRALKALLVALGFISLERRALAAAFPETLTLQLSACPTSGLGASSLTDAIRSELEADGVRRVVVDSTADGDGILLVRIECDAALTAQVSFKANHTGLERVERITLADAVPDARARALALALAELVRTSWPVLDASPSSSAAESNRERESSGPANEAAKDRPPAAKSATTKSATTKPATTKPEPASSDALESHVDVPSGHGKSQRRSGALHFAASARLRWFIDYRSLLLGGDLGADYRAWRLRTELLVASSSDELGTAWFGSASVCVGYRVFDLPLGSTRLAAYPMAALGLTWLRGDSSSASTRVDPATGFYGDLRVLLEAQLSRWPLAPTLSAELGRATGFEARAGSRTIGSTGGFFFGASLGARY